MGSPPNDKHSLMGVASEWGLLGGEPRQGGIWKPDTTTLDRLG